MERIGATLKRLWREEDAVSAVEYGIIAGIIAVGLIATLIAFRGKLSAMFTKAGDGVGQ